MQLVQWISVLMLALNTLHITGMHLNMAYAIAHCSLLIFGDLYISQCMHVDNNYTSCNAKDSANIDKYVCMHVMFYTNY